MAKRFREGKERVNVFEACDRAAALLLECGFEFRQQSSKTEARYYGFPGRPHVIRIAAHKSAHPPIGMTQIVARLTFTSGGCETPHCIAISPECFYHRVATAIGLYMLKSVGEPVSRYKGKRGTWEGDHAKEQPAAPA